MGVRVNMDDTQRILLRRYLNRNGDAQIKFTQEVAKACNNYIPFKTGRLKDMMIELQSDKIIYRAPYAAKMFYTNKGNGTQGVNIGGLRGKRWDKRAWADKGSEIITTIADFVGGRA